MAKQYVSNKDESVRMFKYNWMEFFSHVHWTVPHIIYIPVITVTLAIAAGSLPATEVVAYAVLGVLLWTPMEYFAHRFVFHAGPKIETEVRDIVGSLPPGEPALQHMQTFRQRHYFIAHGVHHDFPNDTKRLVLPPSVSIPLAVFFFALFRWIAGPSIGPTIFAGFVAGYLVYDTIHYAVHHFSLHNPVLLYLKKHHYRHHYNDSTKDFGVTSPAWDVVMGTFGRR